MVCSFAVFFFFQAEDGIRDDLVTGVQTCALPIFGDGQREELEALHAHIAQRGIAPFITLIPAVREYQPLLAAGDLFVLPSFREGVPFTLLDAMAAGLPVVATAVGGIPEVVRDGVDGHLVPAGDLDALIRAAQSLAADPATRTNMGRSGQARIRETYSAAAMTSKYLSLYSELICLAAPSSRWPSPGR